MRKMRSMIFCIVLLFLLGGCGAGEKESVPEDVLIDDLGHRESFADAPERLVSLIPGVTEMVVALGDMKKIVGVTIYDDLPEVKQRVKERKITVVGMALDPPVEKIAALNPDVVLMNGKSHNRAAEKLRQLKIKTFSFDPNTLDGLLKDFTKLGKILGREKEAKAFQKKFAERAAYYKAKRKPRKVRVYMEMWDNPLMSIGKGSLEHELIALCGGENIFSDIPQNVFTPNEESVLSRNPEVILIVREKVFPYNKVTSRKAWKSVKAVRTNNIHEIHTRLLRRGPAILEGLETICKILN